MESRDATSSMPFVSAVALYTLLVLLPCGVVLLAVSAETAWTLSLPGSQRVAPISQLWVAGALAATLLPLTVGWIPAWMFGLKRWPAKARQLTLWLIAVPGHLAVALLVLMWAALLAVPQVIEGVPAGKTLSPNHKQMAHLYKQTHGDCGFEVYVVRRGELVGEQKLKQRCHCDIMPAAQVSWTQLDPVLLDDAGAPYTCPPPPSGCSQSGKRATAFAAALLLVFLRRRRRD